MGFLVNHSPPCILHEDEHLLVANKPAGFNTHSPSPYAGEGIYDWLRRREPRWANLAIIHRLDKATSGLIVFAKTKLANQSLTRQFTERQVRKRYLFLSPNAPVEKKFTVQARITRAGERYITSAHGDPAETRFTYLQRVPAPSEPRVTRAPLELHLLAAEPITGRTHQIRVHAELKKISILGDATYHGAPFPRVCLHAHELSFAHPATDEPVTFRAEPDFFAPPHLALRAALIEPILTNAFRLIHGAADHHPGLYLEQWSSHLLAQNGGDLDLSALPPLRSFASSDVSSPAPSLYHKHLTKNVSRATSHEAQPQLLAGPPAPDPFTVLENGVRYEISFQQGYSVGLFLDQRDNRRRLLANYIAPQFPIFEETLAGKQILNTFAYTCAFSVCAALAGARATSLDLSKKYLEWGQRNFTLNDLQPVDHDFIYGDLFDWAPRLAKKNRLFDLILLDPPTFSRSKSGAFQAEKHYSRLVTAILPLLRSGGILFVSTNAQKLPPETFLTQIHAACAAARRPILQEHYIPQPPDFPITKDEPAYLKTVWLRIS